MISRTIRAGVLALKSVVASVFVALRIPPNILTMASLVPTGLAAWRLAEGELVEAGLWIILAGFFDVIDGAVARARGRMTPFGAVLDSVTDRVSDTFIYFGAVGYFHRIHAPFYEFLTIVDEQSGQLTALFCVSYESLVPECKVGFAERGERMVLLLLALFFGKLGAGMWMLAILSWLTTVQRVIHVHRALAAGQARPQP